MKRFIAAVIAANFTGCANFKAPEPDMDNLVIINRTMPPELINSANFAKPEWSMTK